MCGRAVGVVEGNFVREGREWWTEEVCLEGCVLKRDLPTRVDWHFGDLVCECCSCE